MTTKKKRAIIAAVISGFSVVAARVAMVSDSFLSEVSAWVLFPGAIPNLLFFGVHRDWGLMGEVTMMTISAVVWFVIAFCALLLADRLFGRKRPIQLPEPTRGNGT